MFCLLPLNPTIQLTSLWVSRACLRTSRAKAVCWLRLIHLEVLLSTSYLLLLVSDFLPEQVWRQVHGGDDVSKVTLPAWPGQGYGRLLGPFVFLSVLGYYFALCMISIFVCIFGSWLVESLQLYYILLWVPPWTCVTLLSWFHPYNVCVETCIFCLVVRLQSDIVRIVAWML
jgi:hypothetical protein